MSEGSYAHSSGRAGPDMQSAIFAANLAADLLEEAKQRLSINDLEGALEKSRDSIRMASSALLFRDGFITSDFDKTVSYLRQHYNTLPIKEWVSVEMTTLGTSGLYNMILSAMGHLKKKDEDLVNDAITVASKFLEATLMELNL